MEKELQQLAEMSNRYGANPEYVLAGGGNTSWKDENRLYVKPSGISLKEICSEDFVAMDRKKLDEMLTAEYPDDDEQREALALKKMLSAGIIPGARRPSVETSLHNLFPQKFVLHIHPALVNGLTCSRNGAQLAKELFGDTAVWVDFIKPGYSLAAYCKQALQEYKIQTGKDLQILILQNHGIFYAADTVEEIDALSDHVMNLLREKAAVKPSFAPAKFCAERAAALAPAVRMLASSKGKAIAEFICNDEIKALVANREAFRKIELPFTPDHIVYCKAYPLFVRAEDELDQQLDVLRESWTAYQEENGFAPKVIAVEGLGIYVCGNGKKDVKTVKDLLTDGMKIAVYCESFGGAHPMEQEFIDFIINWEAENYRSKMNSAQISTKRMDGKIAVVTGGAQGFGRGIAEHMAQEGAYVVIADMNLPGAENCAVEICERFGKGVAMAAEVNVSDEDSVRKLVEKTALSFGGIDVFVSCAGVVRAGGLDSMQKRDFDFVTAINYGGYFLCAKYASAVMKTQNRFAPDYYADIIEINSKSGLQGSNKNFAYAGSKFGGIGLTQSFAYELAPYKIKVNAVCPGNFYDGPLWSDPEKGLFQQYLKAGKVPGAKTVADVRKDYESKTPLGRGCQVIDVARAIFYIVEQEFETGQAVPVTGGQAMLN